MVNTGLRQSTSILGAKLPWGRERRQSYCRAKTRQQQKTKSNKRPRIAVVDASHPGIGAEAVLAQERPSAPARPDKIEPETAPVAAPSHCVPRAFQRHLSCLRTWVQASTKGMQPGTSIFPAESLTGWRAVPLFMFSVDGVYRCRVLTRLDARRIPLVY